MAKQVMHRSASDNAYLHKDFHGALSCGLDYLQQHFGADSVRTYLREFTRSFYGPLRTALQCRGLAALHEHFQALYEREGVQPEIDFSEDELVIRVPFCPAVRHLREQGYPVAELFVETTRSVNDALCEGTAFAAELVHYDPETGGSVQRFWRDAS